MSANQSDHYLRDAVLSASPEQLQLMLYDGAIRFSRQGMEAMDRRELDTCCEKLIRAQQIVAQIKVGLCREANPEFCDQVGALCDFVYWRLVKANMDHDRKLIEDALQILEHQRDTWRMLVEKLRTEQGGPDQNTGLDEKTPRLTVQA